MELGFLTRLFPPWDSDQAGEGGGRHGTPLPVKAFDTWGKLLANCRKPSQSARSGESIACALLRGEHGDGGTVMKLLGEPCMHSMPSYGNCLASLSNSTSASSLLLGAVNQELRAYKIETVKRYEPKREYSWSEPQSSLVAVQSFSCDSMLQVVTESNGDGRDLVCLRTDSNFLISEISSTSPSDADSPASLSSSGLVKPLWDPITIEPGEHGHRPSHACFRKVDLGRLLLTGTDYSLRELNLQPDTRGAMTLGYIPRGSKDGILTERWVGVEATENEQVVCVADRHLFQMLDLRLSTTGKNKEFRSVVKVDVDDSREKAGERIYSIASLGDKITISTTTTVELHDPRWMTGIPLWTRRHLLEPAVPVLTAYLEGFPVADCRTPANGMLFIGCHGRQGSAVSSYNLGKEVVDYCSSDEFFLPHPPLGGSSKAAFSEYRSLKYPRQPSHVRGTSIILDRTFTHDVIGSPLTGLALHRDQRGSQKIPVIVTTNAAGILLCAVPFRQSQSLPAGRDFDADAASTYICGLMFEKGHASIRAAWTNRGDILPQEAKPCHLIRINLSGKKMQRNVLSSGTSAGGETGPTLLASPPALKAPAAGQLSTLDLCMTNPHGFCAMDACGSHEDWPVPALCTVWEPHQATTVSPALGADLESIFVPGYRDPFKLRGTTNSDGGLTDVPAKALEKIMEEMMVVSLRDPYLPGINAMLRMRQPNFSQEEMDFLSRNAGSDGIPADDHRHTEPRSCNESRLKNLSSESGDASSGESTCCEPSDDMSHQAPTAKKKSRKSVRRIPHLKISLVMRDIRKRKRKDKD